MNRRRIAAVAAAFVASCGSSCAAPGDAESTPWSPSAEAPVVSGAPASSASPNDAEGTPPLRGIVEEPLFEGDIKLPPGAGTALGAGIAGKRWVNRVVPYVFASNFAYRDRATDAINHWEARTSMRFVARTTESDYVRFAAGRGCSAHVGRQGGVQDIELAAGEHITTLSGADFARSDGKAHYWWRSGYRTVGRSSDPAEHETHSAYVVAAGKTPRMIVDVAFAPDGKVYAWYSDRTYSVGTPSDLGATQAPAAFTIPGGRSASSIAGVAMAANGHVHAWYSDGTTSEGTATDLGAYAAPQAYSLPAGRTRSEIVAFGIANDGHAYAWYGAGKASAGSTTDLGSFREPYAVKVMGHCGVGQAIHEIGHAVGMFHEQSRLDRDSYVTIDLGNVLAGKESNFNKHGLGNDHGPYDFDSVMHYDSYAFSKNGQPTIVRKNGALIADPDVLSAGDVASIALMYP